MPMAVSDMYVNLSGGYGDFIISSVIDINSHDFGGAFAAINSLPVLVSNSSVFDSGGRQYAEMVLLVNNSEYDYVMWVIEEIGGVTSFTERRTTLGGHADVGFLSSNAAAREDEYQRLIGMYAMAENVRDLSAVNGRISTVINEKDYYNTQLANLRTASNRATVNVRLTGLREMPVSDTASGTFTARFTDSFRGIAGVSEDVFLWFVRALLPVTLILSSGYVIWFLARKIRRKNGRDGNVR
jgi:hypothetical protein